MASTELSVQYGRSHTQARYHFSNRVTAILGPNGSGKTTLLEAIHIALRGTSFRGSDGEFLQRGADWWRVDLRRPNDVRSVTYQPDLPARKKRFIINNVTHYRLPLAKKYPVVVFVPDDLRVLHGSPTPYYLRRRVYMGRRPGGVRRSNCPRPRTPVGTDEYRTWPYLPQYCRAG